MTNAQKIPAELLYTPTDPAYDEAPRKYQGCPTLAVTKGGRIWLGWYAGGVREILFLHCSEEDIMNPDVQPEAKIVSKPDME